ETERGSIESQRLEYEFFSSLTLSNGTTKTTNRNRLDDVDKWMYEFLTPESELRILDVGISSGVTTVELSKFLASVNVKHEILGIDSDLSAYLLELNRKHSVLFDRRGNPIHYEINGKGYGQAKGSNLLIRAKRFLLKHLAITLIKPTFKNGFIDFAVASRYFGRRISRVELTCQEVQTN